MYQQFQDSSRPQEFERLLRDGIFAVRAGQTKLAQSLLRQAASLNGYDARPYLWLSATTEDPTERREYLEQAVAIDPGNVAARRGLAELTGKIDTNTMLPEGAGVIPRGPVEVEAQIQTFTCPNCGGRMSFSAESRRLTCAYCGFQKRAEEKQVGGEIEQPLDFVIPTSEGHRWAEAQHRLLCENCGALTLLPPGEATNQCPYCGANQFVEPSEVSEIIDPAAIGLMKVKAEDVKKNVRAWLGKGLFAPDDLVATVKGLKMRPAYYSFWSFDGTLEVRWKCEVNVGNDDSDRWEPRNGVETRFFDDVLVPGVKTLKLWETQRIEPFDLKELVTFDPDYLAGWPAILYHRSLTDASLLGRERVFKSSRGNISASIEPMHQKRNIQLSAGSWSGMSYKHILLPVWVGSYHYQNKTYSLLVNGQTGKVGGSKPRDEIKIILAALIVGGLLLLAVVLGLIWFASQPPF